MTVRDASDGHPVDDGSGLPEESRHSRRAASAPVDAVPEHREHPEERESQVRARDREALRAYRALAEGRPAEAADGARVEVPTRRTLRVQRVGASSSSGVTPGSTADLPAQAPALHPASAAHPGTSTGSTERVALPGGRRDRRRQETAQTAAVVPQGTDVDGSSLSADDDTPAARPEARADERSGAPSNGNMTVEEALAARNALVQDARALVAGLETTDGDGGIVVDLEILAQQKALAERAAVLNARARRIQELAEQNQQRKPVPNDPTTAHNIPFAPHSDASRRAGDAPSALRAPRTSHIPVVVPRASSADPGPDPGSETAVAPPAEGEATRGTGPIGARTAFGLDPLDAMTAGLGRARRLRILQYSLLGVGGAALVTGIMMTVSSLNG